MVVVKGVPPSLGVVTTTVVEVALRVVLCPLGEPLLGAKVRVAPLPLPPEGVDVGDSESPVVCRRDV